MSQGGSVAAASSEEQPADGTAAKIGHQALVAPKGWQVPSFCLDVFKPFEAIIAADNRTRDTKEAENGRSRRTALKASVDLLEFYQRCKSDFRYTSNLNPRRCLTKPSDPVDAGGADNSEADLIVYVNDVLISTCTGRRYVVIDKLGQGTFGQVCSGLTLHAFNPF